MNSETTSDSNKYLFTTTDCIGRNVSLKKATFSEKIIKDHPEMTLDIIKESVECAHLVTPDSQHDKRRIYYKIIEIPIEDRSNLTNIKVVVEETTNKDGEIVTAFLLGRMRGETSKGEIIYDAGSSSKS
ncbi:MAG: hypothetical protein DNFNHJIP_00145 [Candidatus Argoarchaeum ethanivorans]|uniref:Uncharacterized protein n=1 Tax=Candidatus Argoarchaeum ethanivorans TaxID=2608793 RepID=A0A811ZZD0_9EURY|nr:MAG: hypothetical protein DNFNHJIP_00145 [Candidatus Argoarchaeum ethanivorans]